MKPDTDEIIYAIAAPKKPVRVAHAKPPARPPPVWPPTTT